MKPAPGRVGTMAQARSKGHTSSMPARQALAPVRQAGEPALLQLALAGPQVAGPSGALALQRLAGNRAVTRLIQAKMLVGGIGDQYEQEADRAAEQVLGMPSPDVRASEREARPQARPVAAGLTPVAQREADGRPARNGTGEFAAGLAVESRLAARRGSGSPLPADVRDYMEPRFGADLSGVRLHADAEAADLNRALSARAFTHGQDIYVGAEGLQPGTQSGRQLLAHELAHVIQQSRASDRIARWGSFGGGTPHKVITEDGFHMLDRNVRKWYSQEAQNYLADHSDEMDMRAWYLGMVGYHMKVRQAWTRFRGKGMYTEQLTDKQKRGMTPSLIREHDMQAARQYDNMVGYARNASEAPNHAEAGMYKEDATPVNLARRDAYIEQAIAAWQSGNRHTAMHTLALGLHCAQDRGAHGDGKPGLGHDPRRTQPPPPGATTAQYFLKSNPGWKKEGDPVTWGFSDCDNINKNPDGFPIALAETMYVLRAFVQGLGIQTGKEVSEKSMQTGAGLAAWKKPSWWRRAGRTLGTFFGGKDVIRP